jgi:hypothetical protein
LRTLRRFGWIAARIDADECFISTKQPGLLLLFWFLSAVPLGRQGSAGADAGEDEFLFVESALGVI